MADEKGHLMRQRGCAPASRSGGNNIGDVSATNVNQVQEIIVRVHFVLYEKPSGKVLEEFDLTENSTNLVASLSGFTQGEVSKRKIEFAMKSIALDARNRLLLYQEK